VPLPLSGNSLARNAPSRIAGWQADVVALPICIGRFLTRFNRR
jgi:hypothetical protein